MEYSPGVVRHFDAPRWARELRQDLPGLVSGDAEDRTLHVWIRFQLQLIDGVVRAVGFRAFGCPHTVAAADVAAEWLEGRSVGEACGIDVRGLCAHLEVPVEKLGKLLRIEDAVAACWRTYSQGS
jgi:NifU-like protein involved in Fe-S cluster formation